MLKTWESKVLFIVIVVMAIVWITQPDNGALQQHKKDLKASNHRTDSINLLYIGAMKRVNKLEIKRKQDSLATAKAVAERDEANRQKRIAQRKYESILHRNYTSVQLDSIIGILYPSK